MNETAIKKTIRSTRPITIPSPVRIVAPPIARMRPVPRTAIRGDGTFFEAA
jgi:hypothetical protein